MIRTMINKIKKILNFLDRHYYATALIFLLVLSIIIFALIFILTKNEKENIEDSQQDNSEVVIVPYIMPQYIWY